MDFFDMNFSELFLEKHGKEQFNKIVEQINIESKGIGENNYIELIFKIAFLDFFRMTDNEIQALIIDFTEYQDIDIKEVKRINKAPIKKIQRFLQNNLKEK